MYSIALARCEVAECLRSPEDGFSLYSPILKLLMERNASTFLTAVYSLVIIVDLYYAPIIAKVTGLSFLTITMPNAGNVALIALLLYFPSVALGLILMSNRLAKLPPANVHTEAEGFKVDIGVVERALDEAKRNRADTIIFRIE